MTPGQPSSPCLNPTPRGWGWWREMSGFQEWLGKEVPEVSEQRSDCSHPHLPFQRICTYPAEGLVSRAFCLFPTVLPVPLPPPLPFPGSRRPLCSCENLFSPHPTHPSRTVSLIDSDIQRRPKLLFGMHSALSPLQGDNRGGILAVQETKC